MIANGKKWMNVEIFYTQTFKLKLSPKTLNVQVSHGGFQLCFSRNRHSKEDDDVIKIFKPFLNSLAMETSVGFMLCKDVPVCNIIVGLQLEA